MYDAECEKRAIFIGRLSERANKFGELSLRLKSHVVGGKLLSLGALTLLGNKKESS